ncbi:MAG: nucleotidyltransferase domain-containing protein [bacterium]
MAKKRIPKKLKEKITNYIQVLKEDELPIEKVVLFGSYAKGSQNKWSDVDLCVISPKFKDPWKATNYLWEKIIFDMEYTIEPVGFNSNDFKNNNSSLINEIKKNGIEMSIK